MAFGFELYDIEIISVAQKPVADVALDEENKSIRRIGLIHGQLEI